MFKNERTVLKPNHTCKFHQREEDRKVNTRTEKDDVKREIKAITTFTTDSKESCTH